MGGSSMGDEDLIARLYRRYGSSTPLPAKDEAYVNCKEVRGNKDILYFRDAEAAVKNINRVPVEHAVTNIIAVTGSD